MDGRRHDQRRDALEGDCIRLIGKMVKSHWDTPMNLEQGMSLGCERVSQFHHMQA